MHRITISKRETVTQFNKLMAQLDEGMEHNRTGVLKIFNLEIQETTSKSIAITEKLVTLRNK